MHHFQTNPLYQPTSPSESQPQNASSHHSNHNASVEDRLPHSVTTTELQLEYYDGVAGSAEPVTP